MMDEMFDRHYQQGRAELNASLNGAIARLTSDIRNAFEVLNRIEYSSPWTIKSTRVRCH